MDIIDKYFEVAGDVIDDNILKYMGLKTDDVQKRLAEKLGIEGIDEIIKEKTKDIIEFSCGGYDLRIKFLNWDIWSATGQYLVDDVDVAVDPKSTVELMANDVTYKLGDLFNYSDIDELNAMYNSEEDPIDEDDITNIRYEIQDCIKDWYYVHVFKFTGAELESVYPDNQTVDRLVEQYELGEQLKGFDTRPFALHADLFEKLWEAFMDNQLLSTYFMLRIKFPQKQEYVDYFYEFIMDNGEKLKKKNK